MVTAVGDDQLRFYKCEYAVRVSELDIDSINKGFDSGKNMCKRHATPKKFGDAFDGPEMWASLTLNLQRAAPNRSGSISLSLSLLNLPSRLPINSMMPSLDLFGRCVVAAL